MILSWFCDSTICMKNWTDPFKKVALKRIQEQASFLNACGMMPVAGAEQEFFIVSSHPVNPNYKRGETLATDFVTEDGFTNSPFVERVYRESTMDFLYEIVVGRGNNERAKPLPHRGLSPDVIANAVDSTRKILESGVKKYVGEPSAEIDYSGKMIGTPRSALQSNISLWDIDTKAPIFRNNAPEKHAPFMGNQLTLDCAQSLLQAQEEMAALLITDQQSLRRLKWNFKDTPAVFTLTDKKVSMGTTLSMRDGSGEPHKGKESKNGGFYFEDRLTGGAEQPALAMLVMLGGVTHGVKKYMAEHGLNTPEEMKAHIASGALDKPCELRFNNNTSGKIPSTLQQAITKTSSSTMAKEVMGSSFHQQFCDAYRAQNHSNTVTR